MPVNKIALISFLSRVLLITLMVIIKIACGYSKILSTVFFIGLLIVSVFLIFLKKKEYTLISLLCVDEINSQNSLLLYLNLAMALCFFVDCLYNRSKIFTNIELLCVALILGIETSFTIFNIFDKSAISIALQYTINDFKILFVVIVSYFYFKGCDARKIQVALLFVFISQFLYIIVGYILGLKSTRLVDFDMGVGYSAILFLFLPYIYSKIIFEKNNRFRYLFLTSMLLIAMYKCHILSAQNLLSIPLVTMFVLFTSRRSIVSKIIILSVISITILLLPLILQLLTSTMDILPGLRGKIENIIAVLSFSGDYYVSSHSVQVRLLEFVNIINEMNPVSLLIGKGLGSSFTDAAYPFIGLNEYDYNLEQIRANEFYTPHNISYFILKFGVGTFIFLTLYSVSKIRKCKPNNLALMVSLFSFSILNMGFSLLPSLALGIFLVMSIDDLKVKQNEFSYKKHNNSVC
ncbi:hypothetical protein E8F41_23945 [Escherichia coli]|nr:hypothetical protein [Escherichia coli]EFE7370478.1 hypothetical protein [Escherichia coli]EFE9452874.1 hypothetical protein [Escherichia coli]